ncbi:hypothetical protein BSL78_26491 [Apostichopus japonicus]|uniref:Spindle and centriole-associated protein 1 n=1 Tax=Stichopus japonicus TaxID=307972 RepID=A0A2G8JLP9_STIJA|nr:hypothetical protein BSL78_26491 [Apostichopus japonicus]
MSFVRKERRTASTKQGRQKRNEQKKIQKRGPAWDNSTSDLSVHKLSNEEVERRRQIHMSGNLPAVKAERQMRALWKANSKRKNNNDSTDRSSLLQEILYDDQQLRDAVGYSDRIMAVVHDLFGDDPPRIGKGECYPSPRSGDSASRTLPDMTLHPSQLDVLSESVMDRQALNDLQEDEDDYSADSEDENTYEGYQGSLDLERFRGYIEKESDRKKKQQGKEEHRVRPGRRTTRETITLNGNLLPSDEESDNRGEEIPPLVQAINDTAKVKKKSRSRISAERQTPTRQDADLATVIRGIQGDVEEYERLTGSEVLPDCNQDLSSGSTLFLVQTIQTLIQHLTEKERLFGNNSVSNLKAQTEDQRNLINALTLELINTQERLSKLEEAVKNLRLSRGSPSISSTTLDGQAELNPTHEESHGLPDEGHRSVSNKTGPMTREANPQMTADGQIVRNHSLTHLDNQHEKPQRMTQQPQNGLPAPHQEQQFSMHSHHGQFPEVLNRDRQLYQMNPRNAMQDLGSSGASLSQQAGQNLAGHRDQQALLVRANDHRNVSAGPENQDSIFGNQGDFGRHQDSHHQNQFGITGGHQDRAWPSGDPEQRQKVPCGQDCHPDPRQVFMRDQLNVHVRQAAHTDFVGNDQQRTSVGHQQTTDGHPGFHRDQAFQRGPLSRSREIPGLDKMSGNDQNRRGIGDNQEQQRPLATDGLHMNLSQGGYLGNKGSLHALKEDFDVQSSHSQSTVDDRVSRLDLPKSEISAGHPQIQKLAFHGEPAIMLSPPRQMDRRALFKAHGPNQVRRALYTDNADRMGELSHAGVGLDHPVHKFQNHEPNYQDIKKNTDKDSRVDFEGRHEAARSVFSMQGEISRHHKPLISERQMRPFEQHAGQEGTNADPDILDGVVASDREDLSEQYRQESDSNRDVFAQTGLKEGEKLQVDTSLFSTDSHTSYQSLPFVDRFHPLSADTSSRVTDMPTIGLSKRDRVGGRDMITVNRVEEESALTAISDLNRRIAALSKEHAEAEERLQSMKHQDVQTK